MNTASDPSSPLKFNCTPDPTYSPSKHLTKNTLMDTEGLKICYQNFCASLKYIQDGGGGSVHVYESLVAELNSSFLNDRKRRFEDTHNTVCRENNRLKTEVDGLQSRVSAMKEEQQQAKDKEISALLDQQSNTGVGASGSGTSEMEVDQQQQSDIIENYRIEVSRLELAFSDLRLSNNDLSAELEASANNLDVSERKNAPLQLLNTRLKKKVEVLRSKISVMKRDQEQGRQRQDRIIRDHGNEITRLQSLNQQLQSHSAGLEWEHQQQATIIKDHENEIARLQWSNEQLNSSNEQLKSSNEQLKSSNERIESSYERLVSSNYNLQSSNQHLQSSKAQLESLNKQLKSHLKGLEWGRQRQAVIIKDHKNEITMCRSSNKALTQQVKKLELEAGSMKEKIERQDKSIIGYEYRNRVLNSSKDSLYKYLKELERDIKDMGGRIDRARETSQRTNEWLELENGKLLGELELADSRISKLNSLIEDKEAELEALKLHIFMVTIADDPELPYYLIGLASFKRRRT